MPFWGCLVLREVASNRTADPVPAAAPRCLWIARYLPYPLDAGAKVYSAKLAEALARCGMAVRFMGFGDAADNPPATGLEWLPVAKKKRNRVAALFSPLPIAAAIDATSSYKEALRAQLSQSWDMICLDGYGAGWALQASLDYRNPRSGARAVIVHVSHNHEAVLWETMARKSKVSALRKSILWQNYLKVRALERRLVGQADLLTTITSEDQQSLGVAAARCITLTPGYHGSVRSERCIDGHTPRRVIVVGSFRWIMKQENLRRFVALADPVFHRAGIALDVVGDVPDELRCPLQAQCKATTFHGFVDDLGALLATARVAVVPEMIGGGFKLKFLDYIFARVPVVTLAQAAAGLPAEVLRQVIECEDLARLTDTVADSIDRVDYLNGLQERAYAAALASFEWDDRGRQLAAAVADIIDQRSAAPWPAPDNPLRLIESTTST